MGWVGLGGCRGIQGHGGTHLEVMVAANDIVGLTEAVQELAHELEARRGAGIQLLGLRAVLGLTNVAKGDLITDSKKQGMIQLTVRQI